MNIIVAVDNHLGIGKDNHLLVSIPADMRFFREVTTSGVVIAGRKTMESLPGGQPLKDRTNIVLTRQKDYSLPGAIVAHSVEEVFEKIKELDVPTDKIFVIGGESVYRQFLPFCEEIHMTKIDFVYEADAHFPDIFSMNEWKLVEESEEQTYYDLEYVFLHYRKMG